MASSENKICQNCRQSFEIDASDFSFYEHIKVPPPSWCPECRMIRRFTFWNKHNLFRAKHAQTGEEIFSMYPQSAGLNLYDHDLWWSDKWNPMQYGRDYDFSRPFFVQLHDLWRTVPMPARSIWHLQGSDYCNNASRIKNCYLCFDCDESEDCFYGIHFRHSKNSIDFNLANYLESCYELWSCDRCFRTFFSVESDDCRESWFLRECYDCSNCFGCVNLKYKRYHIWNKPYTKDEYERKLKEFNLGSYRSLTAIKEQVKNFWNQFPRRYMHGTHNENVVGEYVYHAKNVKYCYQCDKGVKDLRFCQHVINGAANCYDYTHWGDNSELIYESLTCGENCRRVKFSIECWPACAEVEYSVNCHSSTNLFGCVGLKKKHYCILNKEYAPDEFRKLRERIISQMKEIPYTDKKGRVYRYGEFFPPELSPLAYNETASQDFLPLTRVEAIEKGFSWREPDRKEFEIALAAADLPDHIGETPENITDQVIGCFSCKRAYRIVPRELEFYRRFTLPLPRLCHACRYYERFRMSNFPRWHHRPCMCLSADPSAKARATAGALAEANVYQNTSIHFHGTEPCPNDFETPYAPERPELIYCEPCYQAEVA